MLRSHRGRQISRPHTCTGFDSTLANAFTPNQQPRNVIPRDANTVDRRRVKGHKVRLRRCRQRGERSQKPAQDEADVGVTSKKAGSKASVFHSSCCNPIANSSEPTASNDDLSYVEQHRSFVQEETTISFDHPNLQPTNDALLICDNIDTIVVDVSAASIPNHNKLYFAHGIDMKQSQMLSVYGNLILDTNWPPSQFLGSISGYKWFISDKLRPSIAPSSSATEKVYGVVYQVDERVIEAMADMGKEYDMELKELEVACYQPDFASNTAPPLMVESGITVIAYVLVGEWIEEVDKEIEEVRGEEGRVAGEETYHRQIEKLSDVGMMMSDAIMEANLSLHMPMSYIRDHIRKFIQEPRKCG